LIPVSMMSLFDQWAAGNGGPGAGIGA